MLIHTLSAAECRDVLARARLGRLACTRSYQPYIVPLTIYFEPPENAIYSFAVVGQKIRWMRENPLVCIEVEEITSRTAWTTVVALGRFKEITRRREDAAFRARAAALLEQQAQWWLPATAELAATAAAPKPLFFRIELTKVTGRRAGKRARPDEAANPA